WYRADAPYAAIMADCVVVIARAAQATGIGTFSFRGRTADPFAEPELLTVAGAFERFAGIDLLATILGGEGDRAALATAAAGKVRVADDDTWSDIFSKVLVEHVEPNLGQGRLTILFEYPSPEAALARAKAAHRELIRSCGRRQHMKRYVRHDEDESCTHIARAGRTRSGGPRARRSTARARTRRRALCDRDHAGAGRADRHVRSR